MYRSAIARGVLSVRPGLSGSSPSYVSNACFDSSGEGWKIMSDLALTSSRMARHASLRWLSVCGCSRVPACLVTDGSYSRVASSLKAWNVVSAIELGSQSQSIRFMYLDGSGTLWLAERVIQFLSARYHARVYSSDVPDSGGCPLREIISNAAWAWMTRGRSP